MTMLTLLAVLTIAAAVGLIFLKLRSRRRTRAQLAELREAVAEYGRWTGELLERVQAIAGEGVDRKEQTAGASSPVGARDYESVVVRVYYYDVDPWPRAALERLGESIKVVEPLADDKLATRIRELCGILRETSVHSKRYHVPAPTSEEDAIPEDDPWNQYVSQGGVRSSASFSYVH